MQALDDAIGLRTFDLGPLVPDAFQLEEQFIRVLVLVAAELAAVAAQHSLDGGAFGFGGGQHVVVQGLDGGQRRLVGVEPCPGMAAVAVDGGLQIDLAHALEDADEEGVHGHQGAGVERLDMPLPELRTEAFQQTDLLVRQGQLALSRAFLQAQQSVVLGQQRKHAA